jgi:tripartite-type tricarboxylate transporter receptor subunit TctC
MFVVRSIVVAASIVLTAAAVPAAATDYYPNHTVKIIVPFGAGGPADVYSRQIAQVLSARLKQSVVVENRTGGGGVVGAAAVAKSPPDGYTLLVISNALTANETLIPNRPYVLTRDFAPVAPLNYSELVMVVPPSIPVENLQSFIAFVRKRPGQLSYASAGTGTPYHMAGELFKKMTGTNMIHLQYPVSGELRDAVLDGRIDMTFDAITTMAPNVLAGKVRALGTSAASRSRVLPDVPTIAEAGVPGFDAVLWLGIVAPAATPRPVVELLNTAINQAIASAELADAWARQGANPMTMTPDEFGAFMRRDVAKWAQVARFAGAIGQ